jgi:L-lysine 6-transaminase
MAGGRVDEVSDNALAVSGRINSTWGGGLVDMVRSRRILEIIESDGLIEAAGPKGDLLLAGLQRVRDTEGLISNVRGRGLFAACDLPTPALRDAVVADLREVEHVVVLPCGPTALRFRPALTISEDEIGIAIDALQRSVRRVAEKEQA